MSDFKTGALMYALDKEEELYAEEGESLYSVHEADRECRVVVETCGTQAKAEAEGPKRLSRLTRDVTFIGPVTAAS